MSATQPANGPREQIAKGGAQGVNRAEVTSSAAQTSAARTRTMGGQTVEFKAVDYQAPEGQASPEVKLASDAGLGRAKGVSSLQGGHPSRRRGEQVPPRKAALIVAALVAVALAVFAGVYVLVRNALTSVNESASVASSAAYATDAYTLLAVEDGTGGLARAYLGYVDSINERTELCLLSAATYYGTENGEAVDLAGVYVARGLDGLARAVETLAGVELGSWLSLSESEMDAVLAIATSGSSTSEASGLAAEIWDEGQGISDAALRGLLVAMAQIGPENFVQYQAPVDELEVAEGQSMPVLRDAEWDTMVRGMRDTSGSSAL